MAARFDPAGRAWIELDRGALAHNVDALRAWLPAGCGLMPALKADAYGHGAALVAGWLEQMGVRDFCVATAAEGAALREAGVRGNVLVLGWTDPAEAPLLARYALAQTVAGPEHARALGGQGQPLAVHVAVDTGMHRLGAPWDDVSALRAAWDVQSLRVEGLYTHLCTADAADADGVAFMREQVRRFASAAERLRASGARVPRVHLLGSYGILRCPEAAGDLVRPGLALYGTLETAEDTARSPVDLAPVLSLKARIAALHRLGPGEGAGYGLAFRAARETVLAAASIGYADGLPRCVGEGRGRALVRGRSVPIVGRVCMDQCLLDVTDVPGAAVGDAAVFIGADGEERITVCELAGTAGTIANEILSRLGPRLERVAV